MECSVNNTRFFILIKTWSYLFKTVFEEFKTDHLVEKVQLLEVTHSYTSEIKMVEMSLNVLILMIQLN